MNSSFITGFMTKCAESGLSQPQAAQLLKQAGSMYALENWLHDNPELVFSMLGGGLGGAGLGAYMAEEGSRGKGALLGGAGGLGAGAGVGLGLKELNDPSRGGLLSGFGF